MLMSTYRFETYKVNSTGTYDTNGYAKTIRLDSTFANKDKIENSNLEYQWQDNTNSYSILLLP